jgi:hypothetical protein
VVGGTRTDRERTLLDLIASDSWRMDVLRTVRGLGLPDWAIGAGFVRSCVWDWLSGYEKSTIPTDIDVLYYDPSDLSPEREAICERRLVAMHTVPWSVTNQARMHIYNGDAPYASTIDALRFWLETPTCVAVRLTGDDQLELLAPWGLDDLFAMIVRPTPSGCDKSALYRQRIAEKNWTERWPRVQVIAPP